MTETDGNLSRAAASDVTGANDADATNATNANVGYDKDGSKEQQQQLGREDDDDSSNVEMEGERTFE